MSGALAIPWVVGQIFEAGAQLLPLFLADQRWPGRDLVGWELRRRCSTEPQSFPVSVPLLTSLRFNSVPAQQ